MDMEWVFSRHCKSYMHCRYKICNCSERVHTRLKWTNSGCKNHLDERILAEQNRLTKYVSESAEIRKSEQETPCCMLYLRTACFDPMFDTSIFRMQMVQMFTSVSHVRHVSDRALEHSRLSQNCAIRFPNIRRLLIFWLVSAVNCVFLTTSSNVKDSPIEFNLFQLRYFLESVIPFQNSSIALVRRHGGTSSAIHTHTPTNNECMIMIHYKYSLSEGHLGKKYEY